MCAMLRKNMMTVSQISKVPSINSFCLYLKMSVLTFMKNRHVIRAWAMLNASVIGNLLY